MSPVYLSIMLHYHTTPSDYNGPESKSFIRSAIADLYEKGMLCNDELQSAINFKITHKGNTFVDALTSIPYPILIEKWGFPKFEMPLVNIETTGD